MRRRNAAIGVTVALLVAAPALAGCAHATPDRAAPLHGAASLERGGTGPARDPLAALRAGLGGQASRPVFYLSLGDSLSQGIQPDAAGRDVPTARGYPDRLAARLRAGLPRLHLVKLGCSGETTSTMIHGGICRYPAGSQLAQATRFLRSHRAATALVTMDIGANDPNSCVIGAKPSAIPSCLSTRLAETVRNLSIILARLRSAAGHRVLIVGMTYYVPELGLWRKGRTGREIAAATDYLAAGANRMLTVRYHRFQARVANVFGAFRSADLAGAPGSVPPSVTTICALTWMCARPPRGPNEHANDQGYRVIAQAFWRAITR